MQKTGTVVAGRPTYRSADSTCQCVYVDGHDGFSGWTFFDKTKYRGLESLVKSLPTRCYSPLQCPLLTFCCLMGKLRNEVPVGR